MIFFFDVSLNIVEIKDEISFSYSKKVNSEGSGKIELLEIPRPESFYISVYKNDEYITSGFIKEIVKEDKKISCSFSTFEALLKNYKMPKVFNNFNGMPKADILINLLYSFLPITKSKKADFSNLANPYGVNANEIAGVLRAQNIVFSKIKDGDFHLSFQSNYENNNEFRYNTLGFIVFHFDLGCGGLECQKTYTVDEAGAEFVDKKAPERFLRFTADIGNKAYIKVKAVEKDTPIMRWSDVENDFADAPFLYIDKSIKDFEKNIGVSLPNTKRYLAIQFVFVYDMPNWGQDFSTLEVYDSAGGKHKRTVRGFTPCLRGFEILNRIPISPFSINNPANIVFEVDACQTEEMLQTYEGVFENKNNKIKFDGISLADALFKFLEETKMHVVFALKPIANKVINGGAEKLSTGSFFISVFNDDKMRLSFRDKSKTKVLRLHKKEATIFNNYVLKTIKKNKTPLKCIHYYGEGEGQDVLYCCLFNKYEFNSATGKYENNLYLFSYANLPIRPDGTINLNGVSGVKQTNLFPQGVILKEERVEYSDIKTFETLLIKAIEHFRETQKKEIENFEIESDLDIRLHDKVLLLHQESNLQLQALILEEKISIKKNKMQKTLGVGGFLFNPFDALFEKAPVVNFIQTPQTPFNIKATIQNGKLYISWDCYSDVSYFLISVNRIDSRRFSNNSEHAVAYFKTKTNEIEINSFYLNTLYSFSIYSFIEEKRSSESQRFFFRITEEKTPIRILQGLFEKGSFEGEVGFFLDADYRKKREIKEKICRLLKINSHQLKKLNNENEIKEKLKEMLEEEQEAIRLYLGLEYVWQKGKWIDRRFRIARNAPCLYLDFDKKHISIPFNQALATALKNCFEALCLFESYRQQLQYLTLRYILPSPGVAIETFSIGNEEMEKPQGGPPSIGPIYEPPKPPNNWLDPPWNPGNPIIIKPPKPNEDNRIPPNPLTEFRYNELKKLYEKQKERVETLLRNLPLFPSSSAPLIFDVSGNGNHLNFTVPIYECLQNAWEYQNSFFNNLTSYLDGNSHRGTYLGCAMRFFWQSTLKEGFVRWEYEKPIFFIKDIPQLNKDDTLFISRRHTLSFYMKAENGAGRVELWNIQNYNIGFIEKGVLHFACRLYEKKKNQFKEFVFYKVPLIKAIDTNTGINGTPSASLQKDEKYIHILVMAEIKTLILQTSEICFNVNQKIYIDFKEVPIANYENRQNFINVLQKEFVWQKKNDVVFFNFNEVKRQDEQYSFDASNNESIINPLPKFFCCISNFLLFNYFLNYGERQYLKDCGIYPYKETLDEKGNKVTLRPPEENSSSKGYKGVSVDSINEGSNKVNIYGKGEVSFEAGDYFLMGSSYEPFKAGVIYFWTGDFWKTLLPHSVYHKEYSQAYDDIIEMRALLPDLFFKEFITNALLVTKSLYTNFLDVNNLVVQKELYLQNLPNADPHIKGKVYKVGGKLFVSEG